MLKNRKKPIIIALATAAAVIGITAGTVFAQDEEPEATTPQEHQVAMLEKVCEIYEENTGVAIDAQELQNAFAEANQEIIAQALSNRLAAMVEAGKITQDEADQYQEWLESRPDVPVLTGNHDSPMGGHRGGPGGFGPGDGQCPGGFGVTPPAVEE